MGGRGEDGRSAKGHPARPQQIPGTAAKTLWSQRLRSMRAEWGLEAPRCEPVSACHHYGFADRSWEEAVPRRALPTATLHYYGRVLSPLRLRREVMGGITAKTLWSKRLCPLTFSCTIQVHSSQSAQHSGVRPQCFHVQRRPLHHCQTQAGLDRPQGRLTPCGGDSLPRVQSGACRSW